MVSKHSPLHCCMSLRSKESHLGHDRLPDSILAGLQLHLEMLYFQPKYHEGEINLKHGPVHA
ncbi:hypothetical protein PMIT1323_00010 [Prochlorococcus marinus str. MIT 1323]|nr:hypothetical protein PMIT1323_00010 [Prochlorococcus marinus str. MIT 1323]